VDFAEQAAAAAERFRQISPKSARIISHLDCDGICACALLAKALGNRSVRYSISIVPQLDEPTIVSLSKEQHDCFIFADLGSAMLDRMDRYLKGKNVFVLDHHTPLDWKSDHVHLNPHLHGINGGDEISGSGVVYYFVSALDKANESLAHIPVIGAIGDVQDRPMMRGLNKGILAKAESLGLLKVTKGLRLFGIESKPLHKVLEYSFDPFIPGVSGSESGSLQFLQSLGINPKVGTAWKRYVHLTEMEIEKLTEGIILRRVGESKPEDIFGTRYILPSQEEGPFRDGRELSTLLNACGRLDRASVGIGALLGNDKMRKEAVSVLGDYRREIIGAMRWVDEAKGTEAIIEGEGFMIINAKNKILPTMAGTIASLLSKSHEIKPGTFVMSVARTANNKSKASLRISGRKSWIDLRSLVSQIASEVKGEAGGHRNAAGAIFDTHLEEAFLAAAREVLQKNAMYEEI
jgi:single-stranded-DNA-specific exonuclease